MYRHQLIGNIGQDAEVKHMDNGQAVISFSIATTESWTDKQGQKQERTEWTRCAIWRQSDKIGIATYLTKGMKVFIEGKPRATAYQTKEGEIRAQLEVNVQNIELLGGGQPNAQNYQAQVPTSQPMQNQQEEEDLPF